MMEEDDERSPDWVAPTQTTYALDFRLACHRLDADLPVAAIGRNPLVDFITKIVVLMVSLVTGVRVGAIARAQFSRRGIRPAVKWARVRRARRRVIPVGTFYSQSLFEKRDSLDESDVIRGVSETKSLDRQPCRAPEAELSDRPDRQPVGLDRANDPGCRAGRAPSQG